MSLIGDLLGIPNGILNTISFVSLNTQNGYGSTATRILRYTNIQDKKGTGLIYVDDPVNGGSITTTRPGFVIALLVHADAANANPYFGISVDSNALTSSPAALTPYPAANGRLAMARQAGTNEPTYCAWIGYLRQGQILRACDSNSASGASPADSDMFIVAHIGAGI